MRRARVRRKTGAARAAARSGDSAATHEMARSDGGAVSDIATSVGALGGAGVTDAVAAAAGATPQHRLGSTVFAGP
jgi:hypothetical protein